MKAFILAGGFATRLWPLTERRAKPLLPLAGKPLLTHLLEKIPEGISVTVSTNAVFAEEFEKWKSAFRHLPSPISILIEDVGHEDEKLGALGAVAKWIAEEKIEEDVLLLAGDNYCGFPLERLLERFAGKPLLAAHDLHDTEAAKKFGTIILEEGSDLTTGSFRVKEFEEKPAHPQSTLVSTGCSVFPAETLPLLLAYARHHPDNIGGIFEYFLQEKMEVDCVPFEEAWFDIGSFAAYLEATKMLVGENVLGKKNACNRESKFAGSVVLGKGSHVRRSRLKNVVLFENCEIEDCILEDCVVDDGCVLQGVDLRGKMIRAGTRLIR